MENIVTGVVVISFIYLLVLTLIYLLRGPLIFGNAISCILAIPLIPSLIALTVFLFGVILFPASLFIQTFLNYPDRLVALTISTVVVLLAFITIVVIIKRIDLFRPAGTREHLLEMVVLTLVFLVMAACYVMGIAFISLIQTGWK